MSWKPQVKPPEGGGEEQWGGRRRLQAGSTETGQWQGRPLAVSFLAP